ncbi:alpha/beta hydrolase [Candidatus Puniceispirillum sp.]|nr:alpha/beta hydrolase [Candidatus Puniceispirillum sp.]
MQSGTEYIINQSGKIAYNRVPGKSPGVVFLCGHGSHKEGSKALFIEAWAKSYGQAFLRFDYSGHGSSDGLFLETNISNWTRDAITVLDNLTEGPQILVGSSLGGWIMLNVAIKRPSRVAALIGIAAAPDFTEDLIWNPLDAKSRSAFEAAGQIAMENPYANEPVIYPYHLIEDGRQHLRLRGPLPITQPVRLLHGINDAEVPWQTAVKLTDCLQSDDVLLHFDKAATHRFSEPAQLQSIQTVLEQVITHIQHKQST